MCGVTEGDMLRGMLGAIDGLCGMLGAIEARGMEGAMLGRKEGPMLGVGVEGAMVARG